MCPNLQIYERSNSRLVVGFAAGWRAVRGAPIREPSVTKAHINNTIHT